MRKIIKGIAAVLCTAFMLGGVTACGTVSAYDIAVKNGYKGTEAEWLKSLQGTDGKDGQDLTADDLYNTAKENGYQGTYIQFCKEVLQVEVQEDNDVDTIAKNVLSVVSIYCGFSKSVYGMLGDVKTEYSASAGSGVILDLDTEEGDALIVTNYHVVYDSGSKTKAGISDSIYLYTYGAMNGFGKQTVGGYADKTGDGIKATYVGGAMEYDIAVLRVEDSEYLKKALAAEAQFANSDEVQLGEKVFAIGNPDGAGIAVTEGIISVDSEYITMTSTDGSNNVVDYRVMRTDAAINSGNSGGALFNAEGGLIGIVNAKNASSDVDNMGYALPGTQVRNLCENILKNEKLYGDGSARVATLGITVSITDTEAYLDAKGALRILEEITVSRVNTFGSASSVLMEGDVLKAIRINDGEWFQFTRQYQLLDQLLTVFRGDTVQLRLVRDGTEKTVTIAFDRENKFTKYA